MLESHGLPTVVIGLVRLHMEIMQPPRGLWVPFQLGRPLGEPGDGAFQRRVLLQALRLLEHTVGPVQLEDFTEDAPSRQDRPDWRPPFSLPQLADPEADGWAVALAAELALVRPWWQRAQNRFGRTTVGISGQPPEAWPGFVAAFLKGGLPSGPLPHATPALALRFLADDLKAFYMEAVQAEGEQPSSRQIEAWFWETTLAARLLMSLRTAALASNNNALRTVSRFLVPAPQLLR